MSSFTTRKLEFFRQDYKNWGSDPLEFNIFDLIFLACSKSKYDFETGKIKGIDLKTHAFEILNELKLLLEKSKNIEIFRNTLKSIIKKSKITQINKKSLSDYIKDFIEGSKNTETSLEETLYNIFQSSENQEDLECLLQSFIEAIENPYWGKLQFYIKIARNIVKGKRMEEEEQVNFGSINEKFSFEDDLEQFQKEINEGVEQTNILDQKNDLESSNISEVAELSQD